MRSAVIVLALACLQEDDFYPLKDDFYSCTDDFYPEIPRFLQYSHYPETKPPKGKGKIQGLGQIHMRRHKKSKRRESKGAWK